MIWDGTEYLGPTCYLDKTRRESLAHLDTITHGPQGRRRIPRYDAATCAAQRRPAVQGAIGWLAPSPLTTRPLHLPRDQADTRSHLHGMMWRRAFESAALAFASRRITERSSAATAALLAGRHLP